MSAEPAFVDTNVLVYALDIGETHRRHRAAELLEELVASNRLRISTQVVQEFLVTVTRKIRTPLPMEFALALVDDLAAWPVEVVDVDLIRQAGRLTQTASLSFWDALIVVTAVRCGATTLYTEDLNAGEEIMGVRVVNPFRGDG